jgi:UPF0755 protein
MSSEFPYEPGPPSLRTRLFAACRRSPLSVILPTAVLLGVLSALIWSVLFSAPADFKTPALVRVKEGTTITAESSKLKEQHIVRSGILLRLLLKAYGGDAGLVAGDYFFPSRQSVFTVARRLAQGDFELDPVRVTIPEGATVAEITSILSDKLQFFDIETFKTLSKDKEGYLFPDTYYFLPTEDPQVVLSMMQNNFNRRLEPLRSAIEASGHTLNEIITMASLLEEEARTSETRKMISGVLWNRINKGMKLQVDAVFPYIIGKNTFQVTLDDLAYDSPYNTYKYKGLPPGAISNPGLVSINAAVHPTPSKYLYYLADKDGVTHYSTTYAEHLRKQRLYLGTGY